MLPQLIIVRPAQGKLNPVSIISVHDALLQSTPDLVLDLSLVDKDWCQTERTQSLRFDKGCDQSSDQAFISLSGVIG